MLDNIAGKKELDFLQTFAHSRSREAARQILFEGVRNHVNFNARESDHPGADNIVVSLLSCRRLESATLQFLSLHGFNPLIGEVGSGQVGLEALVVLSEYFSSEAVPGRRVSALANLKQYRTAPLKSFELIKWFLSFPLDFAVTAKKGMAETVEEWYLSEENFAFYENRFFDAALLETAYRMIHYAKSQKDYQTLEPFYAVLKTKLLAAEILAQGNTPFVKLNEESADKEIVYIGDLVLYFEAGPLIIDRDALPIIDPIKVLQEAPGVLLPFEYSDQVVGQKLTDIIIFRESAAHSGADPGTLPIRIQFLFENGRSLSVTSLSDQSSSFSLVCAEPETRKKQSRVKAIG